MVLMMDLPRDEIYEKVMSSGILEQGIEQGMQRGIEQGIEQGLELGVEKGEFDMALRFSRIFGVEEASRVSGFSIKELESGKLINR